MNGPTDYSRQYRSQLYDWLRKSIGMFVQHAHNEVRIVKKFCFVNNSYIMSAVLDLAR